MSVCVHSPVPTTNAHVGDDERFDLRALGLTKFGIIQSILPSELSYLISIHADPENILWKIFWYLC